MTPHAEDAEILMKLPEREPRLALLWTAAVDCGERQILGESPKGRRMIVPIEGGRVYGSAGFETLSGVVLPGGADRQLLRADGVKELDALYEMQLECGDVITIRNRVLVDEACRPERYAMSTLGVTAPEGPHGWLNRRIILGTLQVPTPPQGQVVIRAWLADYSMPPKT